MLENIAESFEKQSIAALAFSKMSDFSCLIHSFSYTESQQGVSKCGSDTYMHFLKTRFTLWSVRLTTVANANTLFSSSSPLSAFGAVQNCGKNSETILHVYPSGLSTASG